MKRREAFLNHLKDNVYCKLGVSTVEGVGVIALRDIGVGVEPFRSFRRTEPARFDFKDSELRGADVPDCVVNYLRNFVSTNEQGEFPVFDLNRIDISFFVNHSREANVTYKLCSDFDGCKTKKCSFQHIVTTRLIKKGEELFSNFETEFNDQEVGPTDFLLNNKQATSSPSSADKQIKTINSETNDTIQLGKRKRN